MNSREFLEELLAERRRIRDGIFKEAIKIHGGDRMSEEEVVMHLKRTQFNELYIMAVLAQWVATTGDLELRLGLARQVHDEARHYKMMTARLEEILGHPYDGSEYYPYPEQAAWIDFFSWPRNEYERVIVHNFSSEWWAVETLEFFADKFDPKTANMYKAILRDERYHLELGMMAVVKYCDTPERQDRVRKLIAEQEKRQVAMREAFNEILTLSVT